MSATTEQNRLYDNLRTRLPGALDGVLALEIYNAVDEFCRRSDVWRETKEVTTVADDLEYTLTPATANSQIVRLISILKDGTTTPVAGYLANDRTLTLQSDPGVQILDVTFSLTPVPDTLPSMPDWFWETHTLGLIDGVCARMMSQPSKPWSSPTMAQYHMRRFNTAIAYAKNTTQVGNLRGGQFWRFPAF